MATNRCHLCRGERHEKFIIIYSLIDEPVMMPSDSEVMTDCQSKARPVAILVVEEHSHVYRHRTIARVKQRLLAAGNLITLICTCTSYACHVVRRNTVLYHRKLQRNRKKTAILNEVIERNLFRCNEVLSKSHLIQATQVQLVFIIRSEIDQD
jgi:hypothetical protein